MHEKYSKDEFVIIAVNDWKETKEQVAAFAQKAGLKYKVLVGGAEISSQHYGVTRSPTGLLIDHTGIVQRRESGFHPSSIAATEERIDVLLARRKLAGADGAK